MALQLGDTAPNFSAETTQGKIDFHQFIGDGWAVLFSHPANFTPVCTTELAEVARLKPEFDKRKAKVIGLSVDELPSHAKWDKDIEETQGQAVNFPIIADSDRAVSDLSGMNPPNYDAKVPLRHGLGLRPDKNVKLIITSHTSHGPHSDTHLHLL